MTHSRVPLAINPIWLTKPSAPFECECLFVRVRFQKGLLYFPQLEIKRKTRVAMFQAFPKIPSFHGLVKDLRKIGAEKVDFVGSVKLHGTNAAIGYSEKHGLWAQSRTRVINPQADNMGFAAYVQTNKDFLTILLKAIAADKKVDLSTYGLIVYGEWSGGKVQKGVAISGLPTMFVIFDAYSLLLSPAVSIITMDIADSSVDVDYEKDKGVWHNVHDVSLTCPEINLYNVAQFGLYRLTVDFANLSAVKKELIAITDAVEKECPAGRFFGRVPGKDTTTGEGIVHRASVNGQVYRFKVKGDLHATSHVVAKGAFDVEKTATISDFVSKACTENRLLQGVKEVFKDQEPDETWHRRAKEFAKWVVGDILAEDMDAFPAFAGPEELAAATKLLTTLATNKAHEWFRIYVEMGGV